MSLVYAVIGVISVATPQGQSEPQRGWRAEVARALVTASRDRRQHVARNAISALAYMKNPDVVDHLVELATRHPDEVLRIYAMESLGRIATKPATSFLVKILKAGEHRQTAARALGKTKDVSFVPLLLEVVKNGELVLPAAEALAAIGHKSAVEPLLSIGLSIGPSRIYSLQEIGRALSDLDKEYSGRVLRRYLAMPGYQGKNQVVALLGELQSTDNARAVEDKLSKVRSDEDFLGGDEYRFVEEAVKALGKLGRPKSIPVLLRFFQPERHETLAGTVAEAFAAIGDRSAIPVLLKALRSSKPGPLYREVVNALGILRARRAVPILTRRLQNQERGVQERSARQEAAKALGRIGDISTISVLIAMLDDRDVSQSAQGALGTIGGPAIKPLIDYVRKKNNYYATLRMSRALSSFNNPEDWRVLYSLHRSLMGDQGEDFLTDDPVGKSILLDKIRKTALRLSGVTELDIYMATKIRSDTSLLDGRETILKRARDVHVVSWLLADLRSENADPRAADALGLLKENQAVDPLIEQLRAKRVVESSIKALAEIGDTRAIPAILPFLRDSNRFVRATAAKSLEKLLAPRP